MERATYVEVLWSVVKPKTRCLGEKSQSMTGPDHRQYQCRRGEATVSSLPKPAHLSTLASRNQYGLEHHVRHHSNGLTKKVLGWQLSLQQLLRPMAMMGIHCREMMMMMKETSRDIAIAMALAMGRWSAAMVKSARKSGFIWSAWALKRHLGGMVGLFPDVEALNDADGMTLVKWYCDECKENLKDKKFNGSAR